MQYAGELTGLAGKKLIKPKKNTNGRYSCNRGEITYRIPQKVTEALLKNEKYVPVNAANISVTAFFAAIEELFMQRVHYNEISYEELTEEIDALLGDNQELDFVKKIKKYNLSADDRMLLIRFCHYYANNDKDEMDLHSLSEMYDHQSNFTAHKRKLKSGGHSLITGGIIENTNSDRFSNRESFKLTEKAKDELLADFQIKKAYNSKDIILANSIQEKQLFYNEMEREQVGRFSSLLKTDSFKGIQARLSENNMRTGFACLFYGHPGCGKTETVVYLCRKKWAQKQANT
jgi:hypothetical protein